uniref:uncharacterized protein LOC122775240 isoform X1 n=1 Tax=Solea senegalensis TaxID=28829 RepID=UPI001CD9028B|nr:uncharacterized protein LOC122775240 isoform X1 [Solea senegalensis]
MFSLSGLGLLCVLWATGRLQTAAGQLVIFTSPSDSVTLPCGIPSVSPCSSVHWTMSGEFGSVTEVVKAGAVTAANRLDLLQDCSLRMNRPELNDARLYSCRSGTLESRVSLRILELTESPTPEEGTVELQCFLNTYKGHVPCNNTGIHINWSTEDNTPINGDRFHIKNPSECFSKLIIKKKVTDHHRKWRCQVTEKDVLKATISHTTTITDGVEEVFAAVGESVSLSCSHTSSLGLSDRVKWAVGGRPLTPHTLQEEHLSVACCVNEDSSLVISKVRALNAGDYQCSDTTDQRKVLNQVRLHTLDVTSQCEMGEDILTLTCVLTCKVKCEKYLNLTWSGRHHDSWTSSLMTDNSTLTNKLTLSGCAMSLDEITCSVQREGAVMASKKLHSVNSLQTPAWLALPLGLLLCAAAGGFYIKRRSNKDEANERSSIGMTHVYEVVGDVNNEEQQPRREAVTTTDSFYDLLQAVN